MKLPPFKLERFFAKYEFTTPYLLCSSDIETISLRELIDEKSQEDLLNLRLGYTEYAGSPELRQEIAKLYETISIDEILVHSGAQEAIFNCMNSLLQSGDNVIVQSPCYQSLFQVADSLGCEIKLWESNETNDWELDVEKLQNLIDEKTKLIVFNCPHNPTGYLMQKEKLKQIVALAEQNGIYIFSDEVYRFSEHASEDRLPAVCDLYDRGISLGVMSKSFGLAGLRIGWIACKEQKVLQEVAQLKEYTSICNSAPSEFLATLSLKQKDQLLGRNLELVKNNLSPMNKFFEKWKTKFKWIPPKAGCIAFPSLNFLEDSEEFCLKLREQKGVLLLPGKYFNYKNLDYSRHFRIGFGRANMKKALQKVDEFMEENYL
ncbi:MAG: aminotransferase class I/II-fold pyridoxal phosphate-dependent enzyme [Candidatus Caenarcaniphilales bacterium]|nr:aminotransferase class I/II-fold pyridoxal phosphate-dependent enzyme [Candidatus Caenarcaniphilales bacterium]